MKYLILLIFIFNSFSISAQSTTLILHDFPKGKMIYLNKRVSFKNSVIDSFYFENNSKKIIIPAKENFRFFLKIQGVSNAYIPFINESGIVDITYFPNMKLSPKTYWPINYSVKAGAENNALQEFIKLDNLWSNKLNVVFDKRDALDREKDSIKYAQMVDSVNIYNVKRDDALVNFLTKNLNSFAALDFYSLEFNRLPHIPRLSNLFRKLPPKLRNTQDGKWIDGVLFPKITLGQSFVDIQNVDTLGNKISLSNYKGKVILLDFWASWCGPCIEDYQALKPLYEKYKAKGFEVFAVSVDDDSKKWKNAIEKYQYKWINVNDKNGQKAKSVNDYSIYQYPTNYLIDKEGKIIKKNISLPDLELYLKKI